jgi:Tol biopolymer transport system component
VTVERRGALRTIDLTTCRSTARPGHLPRLPTAGATVRTSKDWWSIVIGGRTIYRVSRHYRAVSDDKGPIELLGASTDGRWLFFVIDPDGSGSIQADGLALRVISVDGGRVVKLPRMLAYRDYLTWCGGRLVFTAGIDRVATNHKRLLVASPPSWRPRPLVPGSGRAWGSLVCSADGRSVVVQSQPNRGNPSFFAPRWSLWRVGLDGSTRRLTSPPRGTSDTSPQVSRDGRTVLFVRTRKAGGQVYALRGGRTLGPVLSLGQDVGFYGHHDWWARAVWSLAR